MAGKSSTQNNRIRRLFNACLPPNVSERQNVLITKLLQICRRMRLIVSFLETYQIRFFFEKNMFF